MIEGCRGAPYRRGWEIGGWGSLGLRGRLRVHWLRVILLCGAVVAGIFIGPNMSLIRFFEMLVYCVAGTQMHH